MGRLRGVGVSWNSSHHGLVKSDGQSKLLGRNGGLQYSADQWGNVAFVHESYTKVSV